MDAEHEIEFVYHFEGLALATLPASSHEVLRGTIDDEVWFATPSDDRKYLIAEEFGQQFISRIANEASIRAAFSAFGSEAMPIYVRTESGELVLGIVHSESVRGHARS